MKFSKLLVLSAFVLVGTKAMAGVPEGAWTMPEPQGLEFTTFTDDGTRYYLYNPGAKMFFGSGNSWNTCASVRTFGYPFWLEYSTEEDAPEGSYELWDDFNNPDRSDVVGAHNLFTDDGGSTWVDHASQGNYSWSFELVGDCVRFQNVALIADLPSYEGKYLGWTGDYDGEKYSSVLKMIAPDVEGTCVDWKAVTEESYEAFVADEEAYAAYTKGVECFIEAQKLHKALVEAEEYGANIDAQLAVYTNTASTVDELKAATTELSSIIEARKALKKGIDEAKASGFDTAEYDAIYANGNATADELKKALEDLNLALVEWGKGHATVENPADMSAMIKNPNFDNASSSGWSGSSPNMVGSGSHGPANVAETWNNTFDMYQDIEGLPTGLYALGAKTSWRGSWTDMENGIGPAAKLYAVADEIESTVPFNYIWACYNTEPLGGATYFGTNAAENAQTVTNDEGEEITYYSPNDPSAFRLYEEKGYYSTSVMFATNDGKVRIGVKNPAKLGDADNWSCYDTFTLTYYGNGADAAALYLPEALKRFSDYTPEEGTLYTESYLEAYREAYAGDKTANSMDEANAIIASINDTFNALQKNIELWKEWLAAVQKGYELLINPEYENLPAIDDVSTYCDDGLGDYLVIKEAHALTNEELEAEIAKVEAMIKAVIDQSKLDIYDGKDMTTYITNPGFDDDKDINFNGAEGWTIDRISGNTSTGYNIVRGPLGQGNYDLMVQALGKMNYCFEAWHGYKWDVWQEIENLPVGMYQLDVQGYVRCEVGGYQRGDDIEPDYPSPVYLYMNNAMSQFPSVYSETRPINEETGDEYQYTTVESWTVESVNGYDYPNSMGGAAQCFGWGMYKTTAYGLISKDGDKFRIGVKMDKNQDWWCIFDSFKLTYRTPTVEIVKPVLDEELAKIDLSAPMGKNIFDRVQELRDRAAAATTGEEMFAVLSDVYELNAAIIASIDLFSTLQKANEELENYIYTSENATAKKDAQNLADRITNGIENHEFEDADVEGLMEEISAMITKLGMPEDMLAASDADPKECTAVIRSNSFEDFEGNNSSAGWTNPGNLGNDDTQKSVYAIEFWQIAFDMYQDIKGLPQGTYKVLADAWCRIGDNQENYNLWSENNAATMAYLYAMDGDSTYYSAPIANVMKGDLTESWGYDGETEFTVGETTYFMPGSLVSGRSIMDDPNEGVYTNEVICKVGEDGTLRVGIKKAEQKDNSWVVADNFKLFYFGANSSLVPSGDPAYVETVELPAEKIEFYNLNGTRLTKPGKGVVLMKRIAADGSVKVQKVIMK